MLTLALSLLGLISLGGLSLVFAVKRAPVGYQNDEGFHFGVDESRIAPAAVTAAPQLRAPRIRAVVGAQDRQPASVPHLAALSS